MKISQKLIVLLLLIGLVPTVGVSILAYVTIRNEVTNTTATQLESTAARQGQQLNSLLREKQEEVSKFVNQLDLQTTLREHLETGSDASRAELTDILYAKRTNFPDIQQIYLTELGDATVIASTLREAVDTQLNNGNVSSGVTVQEDDRDGVNKLYITTPVAIDREEVALATVVFRMDDMVATVQDYTGLGDTGETLVVDQNDPAATSLFPLREETGSALERSLASLDLSEHINQTYEAVDYDDETVVVTTQPLRSVDWLLAVKIDHDETYASLAQLRSALVGVVAVSSAIIILVALLLTRSITAPILRIVRTSQAIGDGDFSARSDVRRTDEIGTLAESINVMGEHLNAYVANMRSNRHRLEVILNSTTESIMAIDRNGFIIIANSAAAQLAGRPMRDVVNQKISSVFTWQKEARAATIDYFPSGVKVHSELEYVTPAGEQRYVKLIISPVATSDNESVQSIITVHDKTESRELENMKLDFVSMAAHELRTPLASLRGYLELVAYKNDSAMNDEARQHIQHALKSTNELSGLITNLLDVARIERGALVLDFAKIDLAVKVQKCIDDMMISADDKQLALTYHGPREGCYIFADDVAIQEVITNLLSNAIKYTDSGGNVDVTLQEHDNTFTVSVADTGIGISEHARTHLFTKFYRVHGGLNSGSTGTGLGLFITKSILDRHDGTITVESEEGVGSTFTFTVPKYQEHDNSQVAHNKTTRRHRGWVTKNIDR